MDTIESISAERDAALVGIDAEIRQAQIDGKYDIVASLLIKRQEIISDALIRMMKTKEYQDSIKTISAVSGNSLNFMKLFS